MIESITYKTKIEDLINVDNITNIISKFTTIFEEKYSSENQNNRQIKSEITSIHNRIIEIAKAQRRKELEKLLEKTSDRINEIDGLLYKVNNEIMKIRKHENVYDKEQLEYEYEQILNAFLLSKAKLETKRKTILELETKL